MPPSIPQFNDEERIAALEWDLCICHGWNGKPCGGEIVHHIDEPFYTCQKCGITGEATTIPKLQEAKHKVFTLQKENDILRGLVAKLFHTCIYRGVTDISECTSGFPGCSETELKSFLERLRTWESNSKSTNTGSSQ